MQVAATGLADDVLPGRGGGPEAVLQRHDVWTPEPSLGISCGSCHLEGPGGRPCGDFRRPRRTPSLAGGWWPRPRPTTGQGVRLLRRGFMDQTVKARGGTGATPMEAQLVAFPDAQPNRTT